MKKYMFILMVVGLFTNLMAQSVPINTLRIQDDTTALGQNIPLGTHVYNMDNQRSYIATAGVAAGETLTTAATSFKLVPETTVIDDDTFATATAANVPSAKSVKALVDNTAPALQERVLFDRHVRYIDIGDVRIQWGHLIVNGSGSLDVYDMGGVKEASSVTANIIARQGLVNTGSVSVNIVDHNTITFNASQNGTPVAAYVYWQLIGPKP